MPRWTVNIGDDVLVIERTGETVTIDIPSGAPIRANRADVEDIRLKLGAAIADTGEDT